MITPRDSYGWNYRELSTLLTLSERLAEGGSNHRLSGQCANILPLSHPETYLIRRTSKDFSPDTQQMIKRRKTAKIEL